MRKKNRFITIIISILFVIFLLVSVFFVAMPIIFGILLGQTEEELLLISTSPNEEYTIKAYQVNSGATVDFSVKVYLLVNNKEKLIYNAYHESEADITWISNSIVMINGKLLDLEKGETYNWKRGVQ